MGRSGLMDKRWTEGSRAKGEKSIEEAKKEEKGSRTNGRGKTDGPTPADRDGDGGGGQAEWVSS